MSADLLGLVLAEVRGEPGLTVQQITQVCYWATGESTAEADVGAALELLAAVGMARHEFGRWRPGPTRCELAELPVDLGAEWRRRRGRR